MKNLTPFIGALLMVVMISSCTQPSAEAPIDMDAVKAEITAMEDAFAAAMNAHDPDAVVAYYADDAQSMPPNKPTRVGKVAIRQAMESIKTDSSGMTEAFTVKEVWAAGDIAVEIGAYTVSNADGEAVKTGKYMSLFEKRDGKYVCIRDIFNADSDDDEGEEAEEGEGSEDGEEG
jgi:uncharacterized protein (TIGR02246 family)